MPQYPSVRILSIVLLSLLGACLSSCAVYDGPYRGGYMQTMPPAGIAYYDYWYYPGVQVYYDINRHVYFYLGSSGWIQVRVLPPTLRARLGGYVPIHSRYARPYREYNEHRRKYPPRYREVPRPPARHNGGSSPYPHNYYPRYQPPVKKAPEQYQREQRHEQEYQRREYNRERPRYQQAPLKKAPADNRRGSQRKDTQSGKSSRDNKQKDNKHKASERGRSKDQRDDEDRDRRDYR